jgi:hypothetical protein
VPKELLKKLSAIGNQTGEATTPATKDGNSSAKKPVENTEGTSRKADSK